MAVKLNKKALAHASALIKEGKVVHDEHDDWSEHSPSAADENSYLAKNDYAAFGEWHLGTDKKADPETKRAYTFPFGDYRRVHRCAVISVESRAAQYDHQDVANAAKKLLKQIDKHAPKAKRKSRREPAAATR